MTPAHPHASGVAVKPAFFTLTLLIFLFLSRLVKISWLWNHFGDPGTREGRQTEVTLVAMAVMPVTTALWGV